MVIVVCCFPRGIPHGLIEAREPGDLVALRFPRGIPRGLIEAPRQPPGQSNRFSAGYSPRPPEARCPLAFVFRGVFPAASLKRLHDRDEPAEGTSTVFRGVFPAASLKQDVGPPAPGAASRLNVFRGVFPAASLKRLALARSCRSAEHRRCFPRGIPRGLIEANVDRSWRRQPSFSAGYSPRPH